MHCYKTIDLHIRGADLKAVRGGESALAMAKRRYSTVRPTDTNIDCGFVENALVFVVPKIGWAQAPLCDTLETSTRLTGSC